MHLIRLRRPSPALVLAGVALFAATGGGAYAATSISGHEIATRSIPGNRLMRGAVGNGDLGRISGGKLRAHSVPGNRLRHGSIGNGQLGSFSASHLKDGSVAASKLAEGAVGAAQLAGGAVGSAQLANGAVGAAQLAGGAVGSAQLANGAVGAAQLAGGAVGSAQLAKGAVGAAQIAAGAVGSDAIAAGSVGNGQLGSVSGSHLEAASVPESAQQLDYGVAELYVVPENGSGEPEESRAKEEPPLFSPSIPSERGDGATASGTTLVQCEAATCQLQMFAAVNSNRPQPASGEAAADVGGVLVVDSVATSPGGSPVGGEESLQTVGGTPPNPSFGGSEIAPIPTRSPLSGSYPGPGGGGIEVPLADPFTADGTVTVPGGVYIVHGTVNFLHYAG